MWNKAAVAAFGRAIATAQKLDETIRKLEQVAKHAPAFADRVQQLRDMRDNLEAVASAATAIDHEGQSE